MCAASCRLACLKQSRASSDSVQCHASCKLELPRGNHSYLRSIVPTCLLEAELSQLSASALELYSARTPQLN